VRRIKLDRKDKVIQQFVLSLPLEAEGSILELKGEPVVRVFPIDEHEQPVDNAKLKAAILKRRSESRSLNMDWEPADREVWNALPGGSE
jgi:hypothetical protein